MKTALYEEHLKINAKIVDFGGWMMPIHYGSQIEEHKSVRNDAGFFDVSHMTVVDIVGPDAKNYLKKLLANDISKLKTSGKALYSCMLKEDGGVVDDLIAYYHDDDFYRLVVNATTREKDLAWMEKQINTFDVELKERPDFSIIAIQGPNARTKVNTLLTNPQQNAVANLKPFESVLTDEWQIARTGYTGEDGYEIILPSGEATIFWQKLINANLQPCGLGARDTLRLEAGLNLYGSDMDETTSPLESRLGWTIAFEPTDRDFIGRKALIKQKEKGVKRRLVGIILEARGVLRNHLEVLVENKDGELNKGEVTSGSYSPILEKAIGLARIPKGDATHCKVNLRGKWVDAKIVKPPFVTKK